MNRMDRRVLLWTGVLLLIVTALLMCGCKTSRGVEIVERVRVDTAYITKEQRDSIYLRDSVFVKEYTRGETVYVEVDRWKTEWRERLRVDTVRKVSVDSVPVPYAVEVEVERELNWWQRLRLALGNVMLGGIVAAVIWWKIK